MTRSTSTTPLLACLVVVALSGCGPGRFDVTTMPAKSWIRPRDGGIPVAYALAQLDGTLFVRSADSLESYRAGFGGSYALGASLFMNDMAASESAPNSLAARPGLIAFGHSQQLVLADPATMTTLATIETGSLGVGDLAFDGNWLYFAAFTDGLRRVDVTDPKSPGPIETVSTLPAYRLLLANGHAYLASSNALHIVSLATGKDFGWGVYTGRMGEMALYENRWLYGSIGTARGVAVNGTPGCVAVIDVLDPAAPRVVKFGDDQSNGRGLLLAGTQLLATDLDGRLQQFDLTDPEKPTLEANIAMLDDTGARAMCGTTCSGATFDILEADGQLLISAWSGVGVFGR